MSGPGAGGDQDRGGSNDFGIVVGETPALSDIDVLSILGAALFSSNNTTSLIATASSIG